MTSSLRYSHFEILNHCSDCNTESIGKILVIVKLQQLKLPDNNESYKYLKRSIMNADRVKKKICIKDIKV